MQITIITKSGRKYIARDKNLIVMRRNGYLEISTNCRIDREILLGVVESSVESIEYRDI